MEKERRKTASEATVETRATGVSVLILLQYQEVSGSSDSPSRAASMWMFPAVWLNPNNSALNQPP